MSLDFMDLIKMKMTTDIIYKLKMVAERDIFHNCIDLYKTFSRCILKNT